jgi:type IV pilus assembly protein PilQ
LWTGLSLAQTTDYQINDVRVAQFVNRVRVTILADGPVKSKCFSLTNPVRLVVYMPEAVLTWPVKTLAFETGIIQRIEAEQYREKPNIVRLVVYFNRFAPFNVSLVHQREVVLDIDTTERVAQVARLEEIKKYYNQAKAYYRADEFAKAIEEFERVLFLYPEYKKSKKYIAKAKARLKDIEVAKCIANQKRDQRTRETQADLHYNRGKRFYEAGKIKEAKREFEEVLRINPKLHRASGYIEKIELEAKREAEFETKRIAALEATKMAPRQIEDVSVSSLPKKTRIIITSDRPAKYSHFILAEPPRMVVDLANVHLAWTKEVLAVERSVVKKVRAGQYSKRPPIARIVMDLSRPVEYDIGAESNQVIVDVTNPFYVQRILKMSLEELLDKNRVIITADSPMRFAAFSLLEPPCVIVDIYNSIIEWHEHELVVNKGAIKCIRSGQFEKEIARVIVDLNQFTTYRTASVGNDIILEINQPPFPIVKEVVPEEEEVRVSMDFKDVEISNALRILARQTKINIIAGSEVTGRVTVSFRDVSIDEALMAILRVHGYTYTKDNTVYRVTKLGKAPEIETTVRIFELDYAQAPMIKTMLLGADMLSKDETGKVVGKILVDVRSNTLIIIDTPVRLDGIARMIEELDVKPGQIAIDSKIVKVDMKKLEELDINWTYKKIRSEPADTSVGLGFTKGSLSLAYGTIGALDFAAILSALEKLSDTEIFSNPTVTTLDNEIADINVNDVVAHWTTTEHERVVMGEVPRERIGEKKATSVTLSVTPHIGKDGYITMEVAPTVTEVYDWAQEVYPLIETREVSTNVLVEKGNTMVIGGLVSERNIKSISRVPVLGRLPILGFLFRRGKMDKKKMELLIFVTPHIVGMGKAEKL